LSNVWFISDLHWLHKNVCKFRTQFSTEEEHRLTLKENILSVIKKRDTLWILGDSVFSEEGLQDLRDIKCTKKLIIGNHCGQHMKDLWKLYKCFDSVHGLVKKYGCWLTHAPIHPDELRGKWCVHGHTHSHIIDDARYINICPEHHNFMPRDLKWLRDTMEERKNTVVF